MKSIIIAGFGGQGVLFAGKVIALAAMYQGKEVTWISSYGPEMRGGTASCTVVVSDEPIGSPIVKHPDIAIIMNQPSFDKYETLVVEEGRLIINSSLVRGMTNRIGVGITYTTIPATKCARELGNERVANMVMLGALRSMLPLEHVKKALTDCLSDKDLVDLNIRAFECCY